MHLFCLECKSKYYIPHFIMKYIGYKEYSYCNVCYKEKVGKAKSLIGRIFTINKVIYRTLD